MLDDHILLKASVKKAAAVKKELRVRLLETQRQRQKTREELKRVRANFEREERARRRLEDTHNFLTDLEALRDHIVGSDDESADASEDERTKDHEDDNLKVTSPCSREGIAGDGAIHLDLLTRLCFCSLDRASKPYCYCRLALWQASNRRTYQYPITHVKDPSGVQSASGGDRKELAINGVVCRQDA
jgi:hypothetical protein